MIPKCCCDPSVCTYIDDDFNRANETPLASPWTKLLLNDWNLASNVLDAVAAGTYRHNTVWPGGATDARHSSVKFKLPTGATSGTQVEILEGIQSSVFAGQPYDWFSAWVQYNGGTCDYIGANAFYHGLGYGGGPTPGITFRLNLPKDVLALEEWHTLEICVIPLDATYGYDSIIITICKLTLASGAVYSCTELSATGQTIGSYAGLKTNAAVKYDDYKATYYRNSPSGQHKTCPWCHTGCSISSDAFSTNDTCKWDVISGSYSVSGGLMTIGTTPSKIQHHIFHPGLKTTHKVTVDVQDNAVESKVYIGNGYAKLTYAAGLRTLRIYDNDDVLLDTDVQTVAVTSDSALYMALTICYSRGVLSCTVTGRGSDLCVDSSVDETEEGYWAALGGNSGAVFDNFAFVKTYNITAPSDAACDSCEHCPVVCQCCGVGTPAPSYVLDFGAGGLTTNSCATPSCGLCEAIAGLIVVDARASLVVCDWTTDIGTCGTETCVCGRSYGASILLRLQTNPVSGRCFWAVHVLFGTTGIIDPTDCRFSYGVSYFSSEFTSPDACESVPLTLTLSGSASIPNICGGTLPGTITLSVA